MDHRTITAAEFQSNADRYLDEAAGAPVVIRAKSGETRVLVDIGEFERLKRLEVRRALLVSELDTESLAQLTNVEMDSRHSDLDRLMD